MEVPVIVCGPLHYQPSWTSCCIYGQRWWHEVCMPALAVFFLLQQSCYLGPLGLVCLHLQLLSPYQVSGGHV